MTKWGSFVSSAKVGVHWCFFHAQLDPARCVSKLSIEFRLFDKSMSFSWLFDCSLGPKSEFRAETYRWFQMATITLRDLFRRSSLRTTVNIGVPVVQLCSIVDSSTALGRKSEFGAETPRWFQMAILTLRNLCRRVSLRTAVNIGSLVVQLCSRHHDFILVCRALI
jgi:hypothetical protein